MSTTTLCSIQSMLNSLQNTRWSLIFKALLVNTTTPTISTKICSSTSGNFHLPISPLLFDKLTLTIPAITLFLYTSAICHLPIFAHNRSSNLNQKYFPYVLQLANSGCVRGLRSYVVL